MPRVMVTGMGMVSALGEGREAHRENLDAGHCPLGPAQLLESRYADLLPFGEFPHSDQSIKARLEMDEAGISRTSLLAILACREALEQSGLEPALVADISTALVSASTVGGMRQTRELYDDAGGQSAPSPFAGTYQPSSHTRRLASYFGFRGLTDTFNTACSSSANAIMFGARLIRSGRVKRAVVGGSDALAAFTVNGFNALMILSDELCRPFDRGRKGLNLGEGAAYLVLENEECCLDKPVLAELSGFGNSCDAFHASSTSDEAWGPRLAMQWALESAGLSAPDVDYINAHGTGTENNDRTEWKALRAIFDTIPPYNSTKSYTGHTLGAAGSLEAAITLLCLTQGQLHASLRCEKPLEKGSGPLAKTVQAWPTHAMSNSFGFSGNCTSLIFSKV